MSDSVRRNLIRPACKLSNALIWRTRFLFRPNAQATTGSIEMTKSFYSLSITRINSSINKMAARLR